MNNDHPEDATVEDMIDHIFHIVKLAGWEHVGLGSDFDGVADVVKGLEVSFPDMFISLDWSAHSPAL